MHQLIKRKLEYSLLTVGCLLISSALGAQTAVPATIDLKQPVVKKVIPKRPKPLRTELSIGLRFNTGGWSIYADKGYVRSEETKLKDQFYNLRIFQAEFSEHKHPSEKKMAYLDETTGEKSKSFIYGKINNFYSLKLGYGFRKMIAGKPEPGSVSIHWMGVGGLAIGFEKPYYINAYVDKDKTGTYNEENIKYTDETKESFLNEYYIIGGGGFAQGLGEIKFVPGLQAKTGLHFDFAANKKTVLAIETGVSAEVYSRKVQLMARQEGKPYFVNLFASIQFGKRW
jgi:hypothetical protein